jgi:hypothetical protein
MNRLWPLAAILLLILSWLAGAAPPVHGQNADVVLQFAPSSLQVAVGETIDVAVAVENVTGLYGFDIAVGFDPAVVEVVDFDPDLEGIQVALGLFLDPGFVIFNQASNELGQLRLVMTQLNPSEAKSGTGNLLVIRFRSLRAGATPLLLLEGQLARRDGGAILAERVNGELAVISSAVSLPSPSPIPSQLAGTPMPTMTPTATPTPRPIGAATATPPPAPTVSPTVVATTNATMTAAAAVAAAPTVVTGVQATAPALTPVATTDQTDTAESRLSVDQSATAVAELPASASPETEAVTLGSAESTDQESPSLTPAAARASAMPETVVGSSTGAVDAAGAPDAAGPAAEGWLPTVLLGSGLVVIIAGLVFFISRRARLER